MPAETNATEDYSVYWVELGIQPSRGSCALSIDFSAELPSTARIVSVVPEGVETFRRPVTVPRELVVDAEGAAPVPGRISEDARMGPGRTSVQWGPTHFRYAWTGKSRGRVYVVLGLQVAGNRIPPQIVSTWAEGTGFGVGPCEARAARSGR